MTAMAGSLNRADRGAARTPVRRLTVLYDAGCPLCTFVRDWLVRQPQLVPLDFVPAGSDAARQRFPGLDQASTLEEITVVGDGGQVYRASAAWIVCLWALTEHRPLAHRLSTPAGARLAKGAMLTAAKWRNAHRARAARQGGRDGGGPPAAYGSSGWSYDPAVGWVYAPPGTCADGRCASG